MKKQSSIENKYNGSLPNNLHRYGSIWRNQIPESHFQSQNLFPLLHTCDFPFNTKIWGVFLHSSRRNWSAKGAATPWAGRSREACQKDRWWEACPREGWQATSLGMRPGWLAGWRHPSGGDIHVVRPGGFFLPVRLAEDRELRRICADKTTGQDLHSKTSERVGGFAGVAGSSRTLGPEAAAMQAEVALERDARKNARKTVRRYAR